METIESDAAGVGCYPALRPPPADLVVRATRPQDSEAIAALRNLPRFRWGTASLPFRSPEEVRKSIEGRTSSDLSIVADLGGQVVGVAGLKRHEGRRFHAAHFGMGVHDDYQGRGVGGALLRNLVEAADRWLGLQRLELDVYTDNAPAIALYRKFGFVVEGTHRALAFRDGTFVDAYSMARLVRI